MKAGDSCPISCLRCSSCLTVCRGPEGVPIGAEDGKCLERFRISASRRCPHPAAGARSAGLLFCAQLLRRRTARCFSDSRTWRACLDRILGGEDFEVRLQVTVRHRDAVDGARLLDVPAPRPSLPTPAWASAACAK